MRVEILKVQSKLKNIRKQKGNREMMVMVMFILNTTNTKQEQGQQRQSMGGRGHR